MMHVIGWVNEVPNGVWGALILVVVCVGAILAGDISAANFTTYCRWRRWGWADPDVEAKMPWDPCAPEPEGICLAGEYDEKGGVP